MKLNKITIMAGTALAGTAVAGLFAGAAMAQSTGSQAVEVIIKGGPRSTGGLGVQTTQAKDQSIVNKDYISKEVGSANFAQDISLVPGVNYGNEDPTGILSSSEFRMHGFDGAHISVTVDGTPVNDTGNYAVFPGEYLTAEAIDHIVVNLGQTEVDSPTASAIGGTVNIISRVPDATPSVAGSVGIGSYDYKRMYAEVQTGAMGPTGIRTYLSFNSVAADKYKGGGGLQRWGIDGRVYQPLDNNGFLSAAFTWSNNRPDFYFSGSQTQLQQFGRDFDYNTQWAPETATPGVADKVPAATAVPGQSNFQAGGETNFWKLHVNPVDFGDIRGQSRFNFGDKATLTVDPYFFFTIANGGGGTSISECDPRLVGTTAGTNGTCGTGKGSGVDLNHDGDVLDTVVLYSPSNTQTHRYGLNSSFIYHFSDTQTLQTAYTLDYGRHRQTGDFSFVDPETGTPANDFGAVKGYGPAVLTADGTQLENRNRFSIAKLNQISLNYLGRFLDDKLHVNIGVRNPHFERDLNQYCYTYNGSSQYCDAGNATAIAHDLATDNLSQLNTDLGKSITVTVGADGKTPNFRLPFKQTYHFNAVLPNLGASYDIDEHNALYVTYAKGLSAPKTDDLYVSSAELVKPETSDQYGAGYRFKTTGLNVSANLWGANWNNHIVQSFDPNDATLSIDRNVGAVKLYGLDLESGWTITPHFNIYASAAFTHSALQDNYGTTYSAGPDIHMATVMPVKGKELVMTPDQTYAIRATYHVGDLSFGVSSKYTGKRYISDTNDASIKSTILTDLDAEYKIQGFGKESSVQFNVSNLFGEKGYARVSTVATAKDIVFANGDKIFSTSNFYYINAPVTAYLTFKTKF